jgi:hypothetical protein
MTTIAKTYFVTRYNVPRSDPLLVGIELEVESYDHDQDGHEGWMSHEDGSLRNNGIEMVSYPVDVRTAVDMFKSFHHYAKWHNEEEKFSDRTSIHVHVNCQNLEQDEVRNIVLMYALFEEIFFRMNSPKRRHNINCVALTETYLPSMYKHNITYLRDTWTKYTAMNLRPLSSFGTLEFRHSEGHEWLGVLSNLVQVGCAETISQDTLTTANMTRWFDLLFSGTSVYHLRQQLRTLTANQLLDVKLAFI